jgi:hypothetical protein
MGLPPLLSLTRAPDRLAKISQKETNPYARELEVKAEQRVSKAQRQSAGT